MKARASMKNQCCSCLHLLRRGVGLFLLLAMFPLVLRGVAGDTGNPARRAPGKLDDGSYLLPNGWSISPAGEQVALGGMPLKVAPFPDDRHVLVTSNGFTEHFLKPI